MAKVPEPAVGPEDIVFELERFERSDGRLELSGRWFGVRGRRFVRPTLTLAIAGERVRALADLDDKPWAAEDGQPWNASFPAAKGGRVDDSELSVAPDITIRLPAPSSRRARSQRLAALPRRDAMTASWGEFAATVRAPAADSHPDADESENGAASGSAARQAEVAVPEPETRVPEPDPAAAKAELEQLQAQLAEMTQTSEAAAAELETLRAELDSVRQELEEARDRASGQESELATAQAELTDARAGRESTLRTAAQAEAEREAALSRAAEAETARDRLADEKAELAAALEHTHATIDRMGRERDEAVASRGAALVMRGATQALPASERHVGWFRRGLVVIVLLGAVLAALIVLNVL